MTTFPAVRRRATRLPGPTLALLVVLPLAACGGGGEGSQDPGSKTGGLEIQTDYYDQGKTLKSRESTTLWGKLHGDYREWFPDGTKKVVGQYEEGRKVGVWEEYHQASGELAKRTPYVDGNAHGTEETWYTDGSVHGGGDYENGVKVGTWKTRHQTGEPLETAVYEKGFKRSYTIQFPTGELHTQVDVDPETGEGTWVEYYKNGEKQREVALVEFDKFHGPDLRFHEIGGRATEEHWERGSKNGTYRSWHPTGELEAEGAHEDGLAVGTWKGWYTNGQLRTEGGYLAGQQSGYWLTWHENGALAASAFFVAGTMQDLVQEWYPNGKRSRFGNLDVTGAQQGPWFYWNEDGTLDLEKSGNYNGPRRIGDLTEDELAAADGLFADPSELRPPEPETEDGEAQPGARPGPQDG